MRTCAAALCGIIAAMRRTIVIISVALVFHVAVLAAGSTSAQLFWTKTISGESDRYCGWPSVCDIGGGEIAVVFSGDRSGHVCPWGKVRMVSTKDGGETWSASVTLCNGVLDDRDAGLLRLANGDLVLFWFTSVHYYEDDYYKEHNPDYIRHFEKLDRGTVYRDLGSFSRRSTDGGKTWEAQVRLPTSAPHGGIQLADGRLIVVGNQNSQVRGHLKTDQEEKTFFGANPMLVVAESVDNGRNWRELSRISAQFGACEPHLIEGADGVLRCYARTTQNLVYTESRDGGKLWTPLKMTALPSLNNPPSIMRLRNGRALLTYGRRVCDAKQKDTGWKTGVYARLGDHDATLGSFESAAEITVYVSDNIDMGYASTVECADEALLTVFYAHEKTDASIMATKWRPNLHL